MGSVPSMILDLLPWSDDKSKITPAIAVATDDDGRGGDNAADRVRGQRSRAWSTDN